MATQSVRRVLGSGAAAVFFAVGACAGDGEPAVGSAANASLADVTWTNAIGVAAVGNALTKTGPNGWNGGAVSTQSIGSDGAVEFTTAENTAAKIAGLSHGDGSQSYTDIDFGILLSAGGAVRIYEGGVLKASAGSYAAGDVFRVEVVGGVVRYLKNGVLRYTSAVAPTFPLLVDTSLNQTGATIQAVRLGETFWQNEVAVAAAANDLTKSGSIGWNAGASTTRSIRSDGAAHFTTLENTKAKMAGLSNGDADQSYGDIDFALYLTAAGGVRVFEGGVAKAQVGTYVAGDLFRVEVVNGTVRYLKNGGLLYSSSVAPTFPLLFDTSLYNNGATIHDVVVRQTFWQNEVGVSAVGYTLTKTGATGWNAGASTIPTTGMSGGYTEFTTLEATTSKMAGLAFGDDDTRYTDIDYAFYLSASGAVQIYEAGVKKAVLGSYAAGDLFRVEADAIEVSYFHDGALVYTSDVAPTLPLRFDSSLNHTGATIANVVVQANPGPACDPVGQIGCAAGEKCAWVTLLSDPFLGQTRCAPDGTVPIGGACTTGPAGETTGYDDCSAGGQCVHDVCAAICSISPNSCPEDFACARYADTFSDDLTSNTGVCDSVCDPIAQNCPAGQGCYLQLFSGVATCSTVPEEAVDLTQNDPCLNVNGNCYLNGCAAGYFGFLFVAPFQPRLCTAYCSPVNTYLYDPDGDGVGPLVDGADADGAAPADCSLARTGVAGLHCRFYQSHPAQTSSGVLDQVSPDVGFCAPPNDIYGDCTQHSDEHLYAIFDAAEANGQDGQAAVQDFCQANPLKCATSCYDLAHRDAILNAWCASHPGSPSCPP